MKSAIQLVDETLLERDRLVSRTRVFRGKRSRLGLGTKTDRIVENDSRNEDERDEEDDTHEDGLDIFDDTDFYQQLLRDVIDSRSGSAAGTGLDGITEDWRAAQKQRKAKKVVDTRASKGRKLRCVLVLVYVHASLERNTRFKFIQFSPTHIMWGGTSRGNYLIFLFTNEFDPSQFFFYIFILTRPPDYIRTVISFRYSFNLPLTYIN